MSRRTFARLGIAGAGALVSSPLSLAEAQPETLASVGKLRGIVVGSAIRSRPSPDVAGVIARECALITPESALKPANISPREGEFEWTEIERTYAFARANGLMVHGHTLFWHKHPLEWAERVARGQNLDTVTAIYADYVETVMHHFPQTVSWDVFNEIVGARPRLRQTFPITEFGTDFIERLLQRARTAAPQAVLAINENDLECGSGTCQAKRKNALKLLRDLRHRGAPLDAFGIQGHLSSRNAPSPAETLAFIGEVADLGYQVFLSELDVNDIDLDMDNRQRDDQVAELYSGFLGTVLKSPAIRRVVFWGITDAENWIIEGGPTIRSDGARPRPALFDGDMEPKPAYYAVREALSSAPLR